MDDSNLISSLPDLVEVRRLATEWGRLAVAAVLEEVYLIAMEARPRLIVELGVSKEAVMNKVLALAAARYDAWLLSCDLYDFSGVCDYKRWRFMQGHDLEVAQKFWDIATGYGVDPRIDLLVIDTDELYPHSLQELQAWTPFLNQRQAYVLWRCTNLKKTLTFRDGRTTNIGWDNKRGVVRAIEEFFGVKIDEGREYEFRAGHWLFRHFPWGDGLTIGKFNGEVRT